jgi:hypothetical protein
VKLDSVQKLGPEVLEFEKNVIKLKSKGSKFERTHLKPYPENLHIKF